MNRINTDNSKICVHHNPSVATNEGKPLMNTDGHRRNNKNRVHHNLSVAKFFMATETTERSLEALIEASLLGVGLSCPACAEDKVGYGPDVGHYLKGSAADYDRVFCVDRGRFLGLLCAVQPHKEGSGRVMSG